MSDKKAKAYRIIAISLYAHEADEADRLTRMLRDAGWPKANRSLVVREAILQLLDDIQGKSPDDVFRYFLERHARRAAARAEKGSS